MSLGDHGLWFDVKSGNMRIRTWPKTSSAMLRGLIRKNRRDVCCGQLVFDAVRTGMSVEDVDFAHCSKVIPFTEHGIYLIDDLDPWAWFESDSVCKFVAMDGRSATIRVTHDASRALYKWTLAEEGKHPIFGGYAHEIPNIARMAQELKPKRDEIVHEVNSQFTEWRCKLMGPRNEPSKLDGVQLHALSPMIIVAPDSGTAANMYRMFVGASPGISVAPAA